MTKKGVWIYRRVSSFQWESEKESSGVLLKDRQAHRMQIWDSDKNAVALTDVLQKPGRGYKRNEQGNRGVYGLKRRLNGQVPRQVTQKQCDIRR